MRRNTSVSGKVPVPPESLLASDTFYGHICFRLSNSLSSSSLFFFLKPSPSIAFSSPDAHFPLQLSLSCAVTNHIFSSTYVKTSQTLFHSVPPTQLRSMSRSSLRQPTKQKYLRNSFLIHPRMDTTTTPHTHTHTHTLTT